MEFFGENLRLLSGVSGRRRVIFALLAACFLSSSHVWAACPLTPTDRGTVKWNPGHYIMITGGNQPKLMDNFITNYRDVPAMRGVQKEYFWSEIETAPGVYDYAKIDTDIARLAPVGKKLAIVIKYKFQVSATQSSLPTYVLNQKNAMVGSVSVPPYYEQGVAGDGHLNEGQIANFGHPGTLAKFKKLLDAISRRYDSNPNFASVSFVETASGSEMSAAQDTIFVNGLLAMERHAGCAFKHTPVIQNLNYPRKTLAQFTENMKVYGIGLGGPDVYFGSMDTKTGLGSGGPNPGVYNYYPSMSEIVPIGQQVQYIDFSYPTAESSRPYPGDPHNLPAAVSLDLIYDFAVAQLRPNYMFWQVFGDADPYGNALEARLKSTAGLPIRKGCPPAYGGKCNAQ